MKYKLRKKESHCFGNSLKSAHDRSTFKELELLSNRWLPFETEMEVLKDFNPRG